MKKCLKCNTENPDSFQTCWSCGNELPASEARDKTDGSGQKKSHIGARMREIIDFSRRKIFDSPRRKMLLVLGGIASVVVIGVIAFLLSSNGSSGNASLFGVELGAHVDVDDKDQLTRLRCSEAKRIAGGYACEFFPRKKFLSFDRYLFIVDGRTKQITSVGAFSYELLNENVACEEIEATITAIKEKFGAEDAKVEKHSSVSGEPRHDSFLKITTYPARRTTYEVKLSDRYVLEAELYSKGGVVENFGISFMVRDMFSKLGKEDKNVL